MTVQDSGALRAAARSLLDIGRQRPGRLGVPEAQYGALIVTAGFSSILGPFRTRGEATAAATAYGAGAPDDVTVTLVSRTTPAWTKDGGT